MNEEEGMSSRNLGGGITSFSDQLDLSFSDGEGKGWSHVQIPKLSDYMDGGAIK